MEPLFTPIEYVRLKMEQVMRHHLYEGGMISKCLESLPTLELMTTAQLRHAYRRLDYLEKMLQNQDSLFKSVGFYE
jgi:hypothetical protein